MIKKLSWLEKVPLAYAMEQQREFIGMPATTQARDEVGRRRQSWRAMCGS
jgi:hypothetical protein